MKNIGRYAVVGVAIIVGVYVFRAEQNAAQRIVSRVRSGDPEQVVIGAAMTVLLGLVAVIVTNALRSVAK